jgi:CBS-domain-containing membrane protein
MITDRDISMCALFQGQSLAALRVQDAMSRDVSCCGPADESKLVERVMADRQIRRIPVVSAEGTLLGIVSLADLAGKAGPDSRGRGRVTESEVSRTLASICARRKHDAIPLLATGLHEQPQDGSEQPLA